MFILNRIESYWPELSLYAVWRVSETSPALCLLSGHICTHGCQALMGVTSSNLLEALFDEGMSLMERFMSPKPLVAV